MLDFLRELNKDHEVSKGFFELRKMAYGVFSWLIAAEIIQTAQIYPAKWFFDGLAKGMSHRDLVFICCVTFVLYVGGSMFRREMDNRRNDFYWKMWKMLWGYGHRKELRLDTAWHVAHSTGEKESMLAKNVMKVENLIDNFVFDTLPVCLRIVCSSIGVCLIGWHFGVFALGTIIIYTILLLINERKLVPLRKSFRKQMKRIERDGSELTQNWRTLKQFGIEELQGDEHEKLLLAHWSDEKWRHREYTGYIIRQEHVVSLSRVIMYALVVWTFVPAEGIGVAVLATMWLERVYSNMYRLSDFQKHLNEGGEACRELVELLRIIPTIQQPESPEWSETISGRVEFKDVSFSYLDGKQGALEHINLVVEPNTTVALVGCSGGGKSTFASLLLREYDPTHGKILIDGIDLCKIDYHCYRNDVISVVSQDVELFDATIRENIRMVRPHAKEGYEEIAARRAYAEEFIFALSHGYETMIGEDGVRLSGGQRQRLAIARALYRDPKILILDEATSSLDAVSQSHVQKAIDALIEERACTIFVIAHRFSTIMSADLVVVLDDGKIKEIGTHEELARMNGVYKRLRDLELNGTFNKL